MRHHPPTPRNTADAGAQPPQPNRAHSLPGQPARRQSARQAPEQSAPAADPGAIEYASWLRLLRRPAP